MTNNDVQSGRCKIVTNCGRSCPRFSWLSPFYLRMCASFTDDVDIRSTWKNHRRGAAILRNSYLILRFPQRTERRAKCVRRFYSNDNSWARSVKFYSDTVGSFAVLIARGSTKRNLRYRWICNGLCTSSPCPTFFSTGSFCWFFIIAHTMSSRLSSAIFV